jgi:hypothetical protein
MSKEDKKRLKPASGCTRREGCEALLMLTLFISLNAYLSYFGARSQAGHKGVSSP